MKYLGQFITGNNRYLAWVDMIYCSFDHVHSVKNHWDQMCILIEHGKKRYDCGNVSCCWWTTRRNAAQDMKSVFSRVGFDANSFAF